MCPDFSSRHATSRTYVYRLGLLKNAKAFWSELESAKKVQDCLDQNNRGAKSEYNLFVLNPLKNFTSAFEKDFVTEIR